MEQADVDALVVTMPRTIRYFTGYWSSTDELFREYMVSPGAGSNRLPTYAVYPRDGQPALVVSPMYAVNAIDVWVTDLYIYGSATFNKSRRELGNFEGVESIYSVLAASQYPPDASAALVSALTDRGLTSGRLGIEHDGIGVHVRDELRRRLPKASVIDATNLVRLIRMVKTEEEIQLLKTAAEITESAATVCLSSAMRGASVKEIARIFKSMIAARGADVDHVAFGYRGLGLAPEADWRLAKEVLFADFGCTYSGYFSDTGFTLAVDNDGIPGAYETLHSAVLAGSRAMRSGVSASTVQATMQRQIDDSGLDSFPHGHGLGIEIRDYPILVPDNGLRIRDDCVDISSDLVIEPNMVLNLEGSLWFPGIASLNIEQTFLISESDAQPLLPQDRSQPIRSS